MYLGISTGNMQEGSFRADTNISVRKKGDPLGTRVELKNINSFKFISDAIEYEIERQIELIESGEKVKQETRLWDTKAHITKAMRSKEEAADYRYFTEPDLPFVEITEDMLNRVKARMPELPQQRFKRYVKEFNLSDYEADILLDDQALAAYFEHAYKHTQSKQLINWILRNVMGYLKEHKVALHDFKVRPEQLAKLVTLLDEGKINNQAALQVFEEVAASGNDPEIIVKELGLEQIQDTGALEAMVQEIIAGNPKQVEQYKAGNEKLFGFFIGQAMKKSQGKGNPQVFNKLFKKHLG